MEIWQKIIGRVALIATGWAMYYIGPTIADIALPEWAAEAVPQVINGIVTVALAIAVMAWEAKKMALGQIPTIIDDMDVIFPHQSGNPDLDKRKRAGALKALDAWLASKGVNFLVRKIAIQGVQRAVDELAKRTHAFWTSVPPPPVQRRIPPDPASAVNN